MSAELFFRRMLAVLLLPVLVPPAWGLSTKQLSQEQILSRAECVFVGTVTAKRSRWRRPGEMTETIYTIRMDQPVHASGRVLASHQTGDLVELSFAGGTVDGYTIWIPGVPAFEIGQRAVFFCDKDGSRHLSALVGAFQGVVPVASGAPSGQRQTATLPGTDTGWVRVSRSFFAPTMDHPSGQNLDEYLADIRRALNIVKTTTLTRSPTTAISDGYGGCDCSSGMPQQLRTPAWKANPLWVIPRFSLPLTWNIGPLRRSTQTSFQAEFKKSVADWNRYANIFRTEDSGIDYGKLNGANDVVVTSQADLSTTWGVGDFADELEVFGFVSFGFAGAQFLAPFLDVDIVFNSAFEWTDDFSIAIDPSQAKYYFRSTAIHELGHALGREHQFSETNPSARHSVMNYPPDRFDALFHLPFAEDANSIRALYLEHQQLGRDLGIHLIETSGNVDGEQVSVLDDVPVTIEKDPITEEVTMETGEIVAHLGGQLQINHPVIENLGTFPMAPKVTWWLSKEYGQTERDAWQLRASSFANLGAGASANLVIDEFRIPQDPELVGGLYYFTARLETQDDFAGNNIASSWAPFVRITDPLNIVWDDDPLYWEEDEWPIEVYVSPNEKKLVRDPFRFRHEGPIGSRRWSLKATGQDVWPVDGSSSTLKKSADSSPIWSRAPDFWVDATGLSVSGSPHGRVLRLVFDTGHSVDIPINIFVEQPKLRYRPGSQSHVDERDVNVMLGKRLLIRQRVQNDSSDVVASISARLEPVGWTKSHTFRPPTDDIVVVPNSHQFAFSIPDYSRDYPGPGYHPAWYIRLRSDELPDTFIYRPIRVELPFTITEEYVSLSLPPFGTRTFPIKVANRGDKPLTFEVSEASAWLDISDEDSSFTVSPGEFKDVKVKASALRLGVRTKVYRETVGLVTTVSDSRSDPRWRVPVTVKIALAVGEPMLRVTDEGDIAIPNGLNPAAPSPTGMGSADVGQSSTHTFTIANAGPIFVDNLVAEVRPTPHLGPELHFTGGVGPGHLEPAGSPSGSQLKLKVKFAPKSTGEFLTSVRIYRTTQPRTTLHQFYISGTGVGTPSMEVRGGGQVVPNGQDIPRTADGTDFGSNTAFVAATRSFSIHNTGNAAIELTNVPPIVVNNGGAGPLRFSTTLNSPTTIQPGASANFDVSFTPEYQDLSEAWIILPHDHPTIPRYRFKVRGRGTTSGGAPTASNDTTNTLHNTALVIDVLANDTDPDSDALTIASITTPQTGSAVLGNRAINYTPAPGFLGADRFSYLITDGKDGTSEATVTVNVSPIPEGQLGAVDDVASTRPGRLISIDVLANDKFNPGAQFFRLDPAQHGFVGHNEGELLTYFPTNENLAVPFTDHFTYRLVENSTNQSWSTGMVTVTVAGAAEFDWVRQNGRDGTVGATVLAVDCNGHAHVAGYYHLAATSFGSTTLPMSSSGSLIRNLFLLEYDNAGGQQSVHRIGEGAVVDIAGIGIDDAGNRYLGGRFEGSMELGTSTLSSGASTYGVFLAKVSPSGTVLWARSPGRGSSANTTINGIAVDPVGNSCLVGRFDDPDLNDSGIIVTRYDANGQRQWSREAEHLGLGSNPLAAEAVFDSAGNIVVVGSFGGTLKFHTAQQLSSVGGDDLFLAAYTPVGGLAWFRREGGSANERAVAVDLDAANRISVAGTYDAASSMGTNSLTHVGGTEILVAGFTTNGLIRWVQTGHGAGTDVPIDLAVDDAGRVSVGVNFFSSMNASGVVLTSAGNRDVAALRYNREGVLQWGTLVATGTRGDERASAIGVDPAGNTFVLGELVQASVNDQSHTANGSAADLYLAKIGRRAVAGEIGISPPDLFVGLDSIRIAAVNVQLTNSGPRPLTWNASSTNDWIIPGATSGSIHPGAATNVVLTIHPTNVSLGLHLGALQLQTSDPARPTVEVPVTLTLENPPVLAVSPSELQQTIMPSDTPATQVLEISNTGGDPLEFRLSTSVAWLSFSTNAGILTTEPASITVSYDPTGLPEGRHEGQIVVQANSLNTPQVIPVDFTISRFETGPGNALSTWDPQNPLIPPVDFYAVTYGHNRYVAVGEGGTVALSADGTNWWTLNAVPDVTLRGVTAAGSGFVAVGDAGSILYSGDGTNWIARTSGTTRQLNAVGFANGVMVAVGASGTLLSSTDATHTTWTSRSSGVTGRLNGVDHSNGQFLVTGQSGALLTSVDGSSWTAVNLQNFAEYRAAIHVGGTCYVAGDQWLKSTGLTQWSVPNLGLGPNETAALTVHAGQLVAAGGDSLNSASSTHQGQLAWTSASSPGSLDRLTLPDKRTNLRGLAGDGTTLVAVGYSGRILTSIDGMNWTDQNPISLPDLEGVTTGPGPLVAVGRTGTVLSSDDGTNWVRRSAPNNRKEDVWDVVHGNGIYVASTTHGAWWSSNEVDWTYQYWGAVLATPRLAQGNGRFVVVSAALGVIRSSTNAVDWPLRYSGTSSERHRGVTFGDGRFIAVGDSGRIMVSTNAVDWMLVNSGVTDRLRSVAFGNGTWVVVGNSGRVLTSPDAISWTVENSGASETLQRITFGGGQFLAIGNQVYSSADGKVWSPRSTGVPLALRAIELHQNRFIGVGQRGLILQSGELNSGPPLISFAAADYPVTESQGTMSILVIRSGRLNVPVSVDYRTGDGQATANADYGTNFGTLSFAAGEASKSVDLVITNDSVAEQDQEFYLQLESPGGGAFLEGIRQTTITIADDDVAVPVVIVHPVSRKVFSGQAAHFEVVAIGDEPLTYQWREGGVDLTGRTNATLVLPNVSPGSGGSYRVRVGNTNGAVFSNPALLSVEAPFGFASSMQNSAGVFDTDGGFRLRVNSLDGARITIEGSEDLTNWFRLHTILSETNAIDFEDPFGDLRARRFYRVLRE